MNTTGYRPKEGTKYTLLTAPVTMTGNFSSIASNITLGLRKDPNDPNVILPAFSGAIVTDPRLRGQFVRGDLPGSDGRGCQRGRVGGRR